MSEGKTDGPQQPFIRPAPRFVSRQQENKPPEAIPPAPIMPGADTIILPPRLSDDTQKNGEENRDKPEEQKGTPLNQLRHTIGIVNYQDMLNKRARDIADTALTSELKMRQWWNPREWFRTTRIRVAQNYYTRIYEARARELILSSGNAFATVDVVNNAFCNDNNARAEHKREQLATATRFAKAPADELKATGYVRQAEEVMSSQDKYVNDRVNSLITRFAKNQIDEATFATERDTLFTELRTNPNTNQLFGDANMFADNMQEVAQAIKLQYQTHQNVLDNLDNIISINLGRASLYAKTGQDVNAVDRFINWTQDHPIRGFVANPAAVALMVDIGLFGAMRLTGNAARAAVAVPIAGAVVGGVFAGVRRWSELKRDKAQNERDLALGRDVLTGPRKPRREALAHYSYEKKTTTVLINQIENITLSGITDVARLIQQREALARSIAEADVRQNFSIDQRVDLITAAETATESSLLRVVEAAAAGRVRLRNSLEQLQIQGGTPPAQAKINAQAHLEDMLERQRIHWRNYFTRNKIQQDRAFNVYKLRNAAGAGIASAAFGLGAGLTIQEGVTLAQRASGAPVGLTALEQAINAAARTLGNSEVVSPPVQGTDFAQMYERGGVSPIGDKLKAIVDKVTHEVTITDNSNQYSITRGVIEADGKLRGLMAGTGLDKNASDTLKDQLRENGFSITDVEDTNPIRNLSPLEEIKKILAEQTKTTITLPNGGMTLEIDATIKEPTVDIVDTAKNIRLHGTIDAAASAVTFDKSANPDISFATVESALKQAGFTTTLQHTDGQMITKDPLEHFRDIDQDRVTKAKRLLWHENNTPMRLNARGQLVGADGKELQFHHNVVGKNIDLDASQMISTPSGKNWDFTVDSQYNRLMKDIILNPDGSRSYTDFEFLITPNSAADNARDVIVVPVNSDGHAQLPEGSDLRQFFDIDNNGKPVQLAKFIEVAHVEKNAAGEVVGRTILATSVGRGIDTINITNPPIDRLVVAPPNTSLPPTSRYIFDAVPPLPHTAQDPIPVMPIPFIPRHPLEDVGPGIPRVPGYYNFSYDLFRRPDGTPARMSDIIRFRSGNAANTTRVAQQFPPRSPQGSAEAGHSTQIVTQEAVLSSEGEQALATIHEKFMQSPHIYLSLSGAIGDAVISSAYIEGIRQYADTLPQKKKITIIVPPNILPLIEPLAKKLGYTIVTEERYKGVEKASSLIQASREENALVFEFDHNTGQPTVGLLPNNGLVVNDLFACSVGLYDNNRSGNERFTDFFSDLLSIPQNQRVSIMPRIELPENSDEIFKDLKTKYNIDTNKQQVAVVVEASHQMKRYALEKWQKVLQELAEKKPDTEFNIIFNPTGGSYTEQELRNVFGGIAGTRFVSGNLTETEVLLAHQNLVLANDTGLAHIAAVLENGPKVISLHIPAFPPATWITNQNRHTGILPQQKDLIGEFKMEEDDENKKWINKIPPDQVAQAALAALPALSNSTATTTVPTTTLEQALVTTPENAYAEFCKTNPAVVINGITTDHKTTQTIIEVAQTPSGQNRQKPFHAYNSDNLTIFYSPERKDQDAVGVLTKEDEIIIALADGVSSTPGGEVIARLAVSTALAELQTNEISSELARKIHGKVNETNIKTLVQAKADQTRLDNQPNIAKDIEDTINKHNFAATTLSIARYNKTTGVLKLGLMADSPVTIIRANGDFQTYQRDEDAPQLNTTIAPTIETHEIKLEPNDMVFISSDGIDHFKLTEKIKILEQDRRDKLNQEGPVLLGQWLGTALVNYKANLDDDVTGVIFRHQ